MASSTDAATLQVRILENRLDKALTKFNEALSHNKSLRQEIDDLRRERTVFDGIYHKLEKDLVDKKKQMATIIELSNMAYEQRDNSQMEVRVHTRLQNLCITQQDKISMVMCCKSSNAIVS
jgi:chromosome segregation ATPase